MRDLIAAKNDKERGWNEAVIRWRDALRAEHAALVRALRWASASLDSTWAAIGDALCSGQGIEREYANAVARECKVAAESSSAALSLPLAKEVKP